MSITSQDITIAAYIFLVMGGLIVVFGGITVYLFKKSKRKR